ncbi:MAG: glycosyltransferase family 4 protein [Planctomycetota bacterium]
MSTDDSNRPTHTRETGSPSVVGGSLTTPQIGVVTNRNLGSPWASTHYYAAQALGRAGADVQHVAGGYVRRALGKGPLNFGKRLGKRPGRVDLRELETAVISEVATAGYDVLLALHSSFLATALEQAPCPVIYVTDATADLLQGYYPNRTDIEPAYARAIEEGERRAIRRADRVCVPTGWVAQSVIERYHAEPENVAVIEWGANLETIPARRTLKPLRSDRPLRLLFVGLDWRRKGGDVAARVADLLNERGRRTELHVVGAEVPPDARRPYIISHGELDRAVTDDAKQLESLMQQSDFLTHPARAECFGHVLCEAMAFGLPVIATDTGGIPQCIDHRETGVLLAPGSAPEEFASEILRLADDEAAYLRMSRNARADYEKRLNWDRWASGVLDLVAELRPADDPS